MGGASAGASMPHMSALYLHDSSHTPHFRRLRSTRRSGSAPVLIAHGGAVGKHPGEIGLGQTTGHGVEEFEQLRLHGRAVPS